ncbi:hypothetical protein SLEP1_g22324 [Rubroshorea leprosula]|uniref:ETS domain-containing protein n=1 Tax=Rubroshorea leprosula TaxID=152421 RepID=A0AAV5JJD2_9ROSI|nr:hypothetical protein SLEP1_g22324 [Rubroshorea leprosula]
MTQIEEYVSILNMELLMSIQGLNFQRGSHFALLVKHNKFIILHIRQPRIELPEDEGVIEVEVDANTFEEEEDYGEEKDSESSGNSDNVEDGSARRRSSSSGSQEQHNFDCPQLFTDSSVAPDIQQTIDPLMNYNFAPDHENEGPSSSTGKKGRSRNFKGIRPPENRESKKWVKLTDDKLQFVDPNIPRAITSLWKSRFDGPYFTFERVPQSKIAEIYNCFKVRFSFSKFNKTNGFSNF